MAARGINYFSYINERYINLSFASDLGRQL